MPLIVARATMKLQITGGEDMTESNEQANGSWAYHMGVAVAIVTSALTVWTTIVRDDGTGAGFFLVIMAAGVGGFSASFRAAGLARTMLGVAVMQACLGVAVATAPSTAVMPDGPLKALLFNSFFAVLWLLSATFFGAAAKRDSGTVAAR